MNLEFVLEELQKAADPKTQALYQKTDAAYRPMGIRMGALRAIAKPLFGRHELALALQHLPALEMRMLSCMIADPSQMEASQLTQWLLATRSTMYVDQAFLALVLATKHRWILSQQWMEEEDDFFRYAGYQLFSALVRQEDLALIPIEETKARLIAIATSIQTETKRVAYAMNNFVIMAGLHVPALEDIAKQTAESIGAVEPLRAKNNCNTQTATE